MVYPCWEGICRIFRPATCRDFPSLGDGPFSRSHSLMPPPGSPPGDAGGCVVRVSLAHIAVGCNAVGHAAAWGGGGDGGGDGLIVFGAAAAVAVFDPRVRLNRGGWIDMLGVFAVAHRRESPVSMNVPPYRRLSAPSLVFMTVAI